MCLVEEKRRKGCKGREWCVWTEGGEWNTPRRNEDDGGQQEKRRRENAEDVFSRT